VLERGSKVHAVISTYVTALERNGVMVDRVYLFGSRLRGTGSEWSDIDVLVVSPSFAGKSAWERAQLTGIARAETFAATGESVEVVAKSPEEAESCHPASFVAEVLRAAQVLYERVPVGR
jgi:predicted nucleotidyltransferase